MSFDVLFFEVRGRRCALPISEVREVLATPPITPVPSAPAALRGLVPVHGQVLPLVDVGPQLASSAAADSAGASPARWDGDRIIVVETSVANVVPGRAAPAGWRANPSSPGRRCGPHWWPTRSPAWARWTRGIRARRRRGRRSSGPPCWIWRDRPCCSIPGAPWNRCAPACWAWGQHERRAGRSGPDAGGAGGLQARRSDQPLRAALRRR